MAKVQTLILGISHVFLKISLKKKKKKKDKERERHGGPERLFLVDGERCWKERVRQSHLLVCAGGKNRCGVLERF